MFQLYYEEKGKVNGFSCALEGEGKRLNFHNKFIVGRRASLADHFTDADELPQPPAEDPALQPRQLFVAENGGVYRRKADGTNKEVMLPRHIPAQKLKHSADNRDKRQTLTRLKMLIQMRDLARGIIDAYKDQDSGVATGIRGAKAIETMQDDLMEVYKSFVWDFGAIHRFELKETGSMSPSGERPALIVRPNLKKFRKDPDAGLMTYIELFDDSTHDAIPGPIFAQDLSWIRDMKDTPSAPHDASDSSCDEDDGLTEAPGPVLP